MAFLARRRQAPHVRAFLLGACAKHSCAVELYRVGSLEWPRRPPTPPRRLMTPAPCRSTPLPPSAAPVALSLNTSLTGAQVMDVMKALGWGGVAAASQVPVLSSDSKSGGGPDGVTPSGQSRSGAGARAAIPYHGQSPLTWEFGPTRQ
jgi:hypothetical protein